MFRLSPCSLWSPLPWDPGERESSKVKKQWEMPWRHLPLMQFQLFGGHNEKLWGITEQHKQNVRASNAFHLDYTCLEKSITHLVHYIRRLKQILRRKIQLLWAFQLTYLWKMGKNGKFQPGLGFENWFFIQVACTGFSVVWTYWFKPYCRCSLLKQRDWSGEAGPKDPSLFVSHVLFRNAQRRFYL